MKTIDLRKKDKKKLYKKASGLIGKEAAVITTDGLTYVGVINSVELDFLNGEWVLSITFRNPEPMPREMGK